MRRTKHKDDPLVSSVAAAMPLSALAARWNMPAPSLERALRQHGYGGADAITLELAAEPASRALASARRMVATPRTVES